MSSILLLAIAVIVLALVAPLLRSQQPSSGSSELDFVSRGELFSPAERSFYGVLQQTLDDGHVVFGKVRLGDVVQPARGLGRSRHQAALNKINRKHLDFVICRADDLALIAAVELDDASHRRRDRGERDDFDDQALAAAGIPLVRFAAKKGYELGEVKVRLAEFLGAGVPEAEISVVPGDASPKAVLPPGKTPSDPEEKICSACQAPMVKRQARKGPHAGGWFWACSTFPKCRTVVAIEN